MLYKDLVRMMFILQFQMSLGVMIKSQELNSNRKFSTYFQRKQKTGFVSE